MKKEKRILGNSPFVLFSLTAERKPDSTFHFHFGWHYNISCLIISAQMTTVRLMLLALFEAKSISGCAFRGLSVSPQTLTARHCDLDVSIVWLLYQMKCGREGHAESCGQPRTKEQLAGIDWSRVDGD